MGPSSTSCKNFVERYLRALSGQPKTPELVAQFVSDASLAEHIRVSEAAFPAYELLAEELIAERDLVAMRATFRGVHRGPFGGLPATGRAVSAELMIIYRVEGDRITQHWMLMDHHALAAQLAPSPAMAV